MNFFIAIFGMKAEADNSNFNFFSTKDFFIHGWGSLQGAP